MASKQLIFPKCSMCEINYDTEERLPFVGCCGHSVCAVCITTIGSTCPFCDYPRGFAMRNKNLQLIETIKMLQELSKELLPVDYKNHCGTCGINVDDDQAFTCITCISCCESESADAFLAKAGSNRLCPNCNHLDRRHERLQRLFDVQKTVLSKQFANTLRFDDTDELFSEMSDAVGLASECFSATEKEFPFGKIFAADCTDEEMEAMKSSTQSCFENAVNAAKEGVSAVYKMAENLSAISMAMRQMPKVVEYDPTDAFYLEKIRFQEEKRFVFKDKMTENLALLREDYVKSRERAKTTRDSVYHVHAAEARDRYVKAMATFFRFL